MLDDLASGIAEEVLRAAFSGAFRRAQSRKARLLKWLAFASLVLGPACFVIAVVNGNAAAGIAGCAMVVLFFVFGIWAAAINAKLRSENG